MKVQNIDKQPISARGKTTQASFSELPSNVLRDVFYRLDETSRVNTAQTCKRFYELMPQARRGAALPSRLELFELGCPNPDGKKLLAAFKPFDNTASTKPAHLEKHYVQLAALQIAMADKVVGKLKHAGGLYAGYAVNGLRSGFGLMEYAGGVRYEGEFKDDKLHGRGICVFANGNRYEGEFKDDKLHGRGICVFANGNRYEGELKDDKLHGRGTYVFANGERYDGEYRNGKRHGQGMRKLDGLSETVHYVDGKLVESPPHSGPEASGENIWRIWFRRLKTVPQ